MFSNIPASHLTRRNFLRFSTFLAIAAPVLEPSALLPGSFRFLTDAEAITILALCERIIPADQDAGAAKAGVVEFIDRKLAGYHKRYQGLYRRGLVCVNQSSHVVFDKTFEALGGTQQDQLLSQMESNHGPGPSWIWSGISPGEFFSVLVEHSMEGFYGGPRHGGNRGAVSWLMLGLPVIPIRSRRPLSAPWFNPAPASAANSPLSHRMGEGRGEGSGVGVGEGWGEGFSVS
ncbi:MAG TPA: gluconate 2-dehydrogenase subunit 3 family protein [Verrucomicrobiae bacterium]|nr:gluconate 2-dehydrogenase subunit 3 family protein [Verrucomicrobiae bacterium]